MPSTAPLFMLLQVLLFTLPFLASSSFIEVKIFNSTSCTGNPYEANYVVTDLCIKGDSDYYKYTCTPGGDITTLTCTDALCSQNCQTATQAEVSCNSMKSVKCAAAIPQYIDYVQRKDYSLQTPCTSKSDPFQTVFSRGDRCARYCDSTRFSVLHCEAGDECPTDCAAIPKVCTNGGTQGSDVWSSYQCLTPPQFVRCSSQRTNDISIDSTEGGSVIQLCGKNIGAIQDKLSVSIGTFGPCVIDPASLTTDGTTFKCTTPAGSGANVPITVTVNSFTSVIPITLSYPIPVINTAELRDQTAKRATTVATIIDIYGSSFGPANVVRKLNIGPLACQISWVSQSHLVCTIPGYVEAPLTNVPIQLTVASVPVHAYSAVIDVPATTVTIVGGSTQAPPSFGGLTCTIPTGNPQFPDLDYCNCWSGYASSSDDGTDCLTKSKCAPRPSPTGAETGNLRPSRPQTTFVNDKLILSQSAPVVQNRRDFQIQFISPYNGVSAASCNYPGVLWRKTLSDLDCLDMFSLVLPWSQHHMCGFEEVTSSASTLVYQATLSTRTRDTYKASNGKTKFRTSTTNYLVTVSFARQLKVTLQNAQVVSVVMEESNIDVAVLSNALYDPVTKHTFVTFDTITNWPYKLTTLTTNWTAALGNIVPTGGAVTVTSTLENPQPGEIDCTTDSATTCTQRWFLDVTSDAGAVPVCNLRGAVNFVPTITCRDALVCPTTTGPDFSIKFQANTDLCDSEDALDASAGLTWNLQTFYDNEFSTAQGVFQVGDMVYVQLSILDPLSTIDRVTFSDVLIEVSGGSSSEHLYTRSPPLASTAGAFNITHEIEVGGSDSPLAPNVEGFVSFRFQVSRNLITLNTLSQGDRALTLTAVIDIEYHGNTREKRSVVFQEPIQKATTTNLKVIMMGEDITQEDAAAGIQEGSVDEFAGIFGNGASGVFMSFVLGAVVIAVSILL